MSNEIKISIIVPCYKVEPYLEKCVNSILSSSFKEYEIILVDDGSPDHTGELADKLSERDERIKVIHKQNGGVVKARETGVDAARGEWITLVDSDDSITPNALEDLYNASIGKDTDIVIGFPLGIKFPDIPDNYDIEQYRSDIISGIRIQAAPWGRLIRRSIITPFLFDIPRKVRLGDDMLFNIRCSFATDKNPVIVKSYVYDYFINDASITNTNKRDPESEQYFHEMRLASIPEEEHMAYMDAMIADRFYPVKIWSYSNAVNIGWMHSEFISTLKNDISEHSFQLTFKQNTLLYKKNPIVRLFLVNMFRVFDYFRRVSSNLCLKH